MPYLSVQPTVASASAVMPPIPKGEISALALRALSAMRAS